MVESSEKPEALPQKDVEDPPPGEKRNFLRRLFYVASLFIVRQLYRFQYSYAKLSAFLGISNAVSLLLLLFEQADIVNVLWWHIAIIYVSIVFLSIFAVFGFELMGAWHVERRQTFRMTYSGLYVDQQEYQAIKIALKMKLSKEELEKEMAELEKRLFEK